VSKSEQRRRAWLEGAKRMEEKERREREAEEQESEVPQASTAPPPRPFERPSLPRVPEFSPLLTLPGLVKRPRGSAPPRPERRLGQSEAAYASELAAWEQSQQRLREEFGAKVRAAEGRVHMERGVVDEEVKKLARDAHMDGGSDATVREQVLARLKEQDEGYDYAPGMRALRAEWAEAVLETQARWWEGVPQSMKVHWARSRKRSTPDGGLPIAELVSVPGAGGDRS
jgi:hypothetical protein